MPPTRIVPILVQAGATHSRSWRGVVGRDRPRLIIAGGEGGRQILPGDTDAGPPCPEAGPLPPERVPPTTRHPPGSASFAEIAGPTIPVEPTTAAVCVVEWLGII